MGRGSSKQAAGSRKQPAYADATLYLSVSVFCYGFSNRQEAEGSRQQKTAGLCGCNIVSVCFRFLLLFLKQAGGRRQRAAGTAGLCGCNIVSVCFCFLLLFLDRQQAAVSRQQKTAVVRECNSYPICSALGIVLYLLPAALCLAVS